ncbi:hypothetical protein Dsin_027531 [Dipteronia sinensis]|uniref:RRM domain-containing protein n=1 Tax=Dipteronia sinensis TaxID=43782 RepID=A0AAD9ZPK4_9ROSI|nr:hypothetical protein Dsin_027531 [Dipteronia sinensis]
MAFCRKLGMLVKQSGQVPMASMLNSARYMSSNIFVGGLSDNIDDKSLKEAFSSFGEVVEARVITFERHREIKRTLMGWKFVWLWLPVAAMSGPRSFGGNHGNRSYGIEALAS